MNYDVAVIGASTSGLYAAELLASAGQRVAVFERRSDFDVARRTLIVTPGFSRVAPDLPTEAVLHRLRFLDLESGTANARVELVDPDLIVDRRYLINYWAERACAAGASICFGRSLANLRSTPGGVELSFANGQVTGVVTARHVIGADGAASTTARAAGFRPAPRVPLMQAEVMLPEGWDPQVTKVWFDDATRFFYWLIPESEQRGVIGLAASAGEPIRPILEATLDRWNLEPLAFQSAQVALFDPRLKRHKQLGDGSISLVGDAAGDVKVSTVGGTVTGLRAAEAVAEHLLTGRSLTRLTRDLQWELRLHWLARALLERLDTTGYERLVNAVNPAMQRLLAENDRDRLAHWAWRLPFVQPRLFAVPFYRRSPRIPTPAAFGRAPIVR